MTQLAQAAAVRASVIVPWLANATRRRERLGAKRLLRIVPLVALTTLSLVLLVMAVNGSVTFAGDFHGDLYFAGTRILHGHNPYNARLLAREAAIVRAGGTVHAIASPRYPAPALVAAAPLSLLPAGLANLVFVAISLGATLLALRLLGVRDWRCSALACISWPVVFSVWMGNISTLVLLGVAAAWRWRGKVLPVALAVTSVIAAKLFMWPLAVWLLITRRFRSLWLVIVLAVAAAAAGWGVIGYSHLAEYPRLLLNVAAIGEGRGTSLVAILISLGTGSTAARLVALLSATGLMAVAWRLARRPGGEARGFGVIVIAALIATPIAWAHYLAVAFVPIALLSPELSWLWFLPMLAGLEPGPVGHAHVWVSLPALTVEFVLLGWLCRPLLESRLTAVRRRFARPPLSGSSRAAIGEVQVDVEA